MKRTKLANAQNIFFSCKGLRKYFCQRTATTSFLLNLFQDELS